MKKNVMKVMMGLMVIGMLSGCGKQEEIPTDSVTETTQETLETPIAEAEAEDSAEATEASAGDFDFQDVDGIMTLVKYNGTATNVTVPDNANGTEVTAIGNRAFSQNATIEEVILPDSVTVIEEGAFTMCDNLKSVTLGANTEYIGLEAFHMSYGLENINLIDNISVIEEDAFGCTGIKTVTIPSRLDTLKNGIFAASSMETIVIPGNIKVIEERALEGCINLKEVEIQEGVESIDIFAFGNNTNLEKVIIPNSVIEIDEGAFHDTGDNLTIVTPAGSYAEQFAKEQEIPCVNE